MYSYMMFLRHLPLRCSIYFVYINLIKISEEYDECGETCF